MISLLGLALGFSFQSKILRSQKGIKRLMVWSVEMGYVHYDSVDDPLAGSLF